MLWSCEIFDQRCKRVKNAKNLILASSEQRLAYTILELAYTILEKIIYTISWNEEW